MTALSYTTRSGRPAARASRPGRRGDIERELCPERRVVEATRLSSDGSVTVRLACERGSHHEDIKPAELLTPPTSAASWNVRCPIGTRVVFRPVMGRLDLELSVTRSEAWNLGDGTPIVKIEGRAGGVALSHLELVPERVRCRACGREGRC